VVWKKGQHENAPDNDVMGNLSDFYSYLWSKQIQNSKWLPETEIRNLPIILLDKLPMTSLSGAFSC
jgi:hypothetical protein